MMVRLLKFAEIFFLSFFTHKTYEIRNATNMISINFSPAHTVTTPTLKIYLKEMKHYKDRMTTSP